MISAYLSSGHDVVVPQLIVKAEGLRTFEAAARAAEASFHEIVLMDDREGAVARFRGRPDTHSSILATVEAGGGDQMLRDYYDESSSWSQSAPMPSSSPARSARSRRPTRLSVAALAA